MKAKLIAAALFSAAFVSTQALAEERETRGLNGTYTAIEVTKGANVSIVQGDKESIEVVTDGCPTSDVETFVMNNQLTVRMKKRTSGSAVQVYVHLKDIDKVTVRRGASVETDGTFTRRGTFTLDIGAKCEAKLDIDVDNFVVDASTCRVDVEGTAKTQKVLIVGTLGQSVYNAEDLKSEDVTIKAVNSEATVNFTGKLDAHAVSGTIKYVGDSSNVTKAGNGEIVEK